VKQCPTGLVWNKWTLVCSLKEDIKDISISAPFVKSTTVATPVEIVTNVCNSTDVDCLNGGLCTEISGDYRCVCTANFTGQFCETEIDMTDLYHDILNGTFSLGEYARRLSADKTVMVDMTYYEKYKSKLDNATYRQLMAYLSFYKQGEVRYDSLLNTLIEEILEDIYPDAEYLSSFNASSQNVVEMIRLIPNLLSYSKYSFDRYEAVFCQYQKILDALVAGFNRTWPTIQKEATQYSKLTCFFLNHSSVLENATRYSSGELSRLAEPVNLNETDLKDTIRENYNATLKSTERLFNLLEDFQFHALKEYKANPQFANMTLGQVTLPGTVEIIGLFDEISCSGAQIWDSLINYGFWYITNAFSTTKPRENVNYKLALDHF